MPLWRRLSQTPAIRALAIQSATLALIAAALWLLDKTTGVRVSLVVVVLAQGAIAAVASHYIRQARWWIWIQLLFPLALYMAHGLQIQPIFSLLAFVLFLGLYWSTFLTQVPFYPSRPSTWRAILRLLPKNRVLRFIDVGSGLGGVVLNLAKHRPDSKFTGIELAPLPWLVSLLRARASRQHVDFLCGDYTNLDFSHYDVVFAYLSPVAMPSLWAKAQLEMQPGSLLLSYEFPIAGKKSNIIESPDKDGPDLYGWQM